MTTLTARPDFLTSANAARFADVGVAGAYPNRPPYAPEIVEILVSLIGGKPETATALDLGTGTGDLARPLAARVGRVNALDPSEPMIAKGRTLPGGDAPNLRWLSGGAEDAQLAGRFDVITAGESLPGVNWETVLPRLSGLAADGAFLAFVNREWVSPPWQVGHMSLIEAHSTTTIWHTYDLIGHLEERGLFKRVGTWSSAPTTACQSVHGYVESYHSRSSLTRSESISHITWGYPRGARS